MGWCKIGGMRFGQGQHAEMRDIHQAYIGTCKGRRHPSQRLVKLRSRNTTLRRCGQITDRYRLIPKYSTAQRTPRALETEKTV